MYGVGYARISYSCNSQNSSNRCIYISQEVQKQTRVNATLNVSFWHHKSLGEIKDYAANSITKYLKINY